MKPMNRYWGVLIGASLMLLALPLSAFARTIECGSDDFGYRYCRVDTEGYVELEEQLSDSACRRNRTWGYDDDGVWVDDGCRARFNVGRSYDTNDDQYDSGSGDNGKSSSKELLTTAAVVGGLALIGTLMNQNSGTSQYPEQATNQYPNYNSNDNSGGGYTSSVPNWALGNFKGYDPQYKINLDLTITDDGTVRGYANDAPVQGYFNNDQLQLGRFAFYVDPLQDGFRATRTDDNRNQIFYKRVR
ncbi:MAG: DUF3011 domain-containing protein [Gammaproteobacteria bacterium]|nr:DUF3011 domain-containing protein [Gammaproteobacteria bacterium]MCP5458085.1 DUF3011 domain-containing protein [Gammaproteobacteria bacterium]